MIHIERSSAVCHRCHSGAGNGRAERSLPRLRSAGGGEQDCHRSPQAIFDQTGTQPRSWNTGRGQVGFLRGIL